MRYILPLIAALALSACAGIQNAPGAVVDRAVEAGLTVEDAQRAARVFELANNPAGKRCMEYLAAKMLEVRAIREGVGEDKSGPLTTFAVAHSTIETIQNRGMGALGDACGALRMQIRDNATGAVGIVRTLLTGGL